MLRANMNARAAILGLCLTTLACGSSSESGGEAGAPAVTADGGTPASGACAPIADTTPTICSMNGDARNVVFKNDCKEAVDIWWVTHACTETFYRRLEPGTMYTQGSFVTHPWRARTVPAGAPMGTVKGMLIKEFGAIPAGAGDHSFTVP